jgi:hypothetical protein
MTMSPMNQTLVFLRAVLAGKVAHAKRQEGGASAVEWVLISALLIGVAIAVGAIIMTKLTEKADSIDLG